MLIAQSKQAESLKKQIQDVNKALDNKNSMIDGSDTVAEASLKLNGVIDASRNAAAQYLDNIRRQAELCADIENESRLRAESITADAMEKCREIEDYTRKRCDSMIKSAQTEARKYLSGYPKIPN